MHFVRSGSPDTITRLLSVAGAAEPTYPERGATLSGELPPGYDHLSEGTILGQGPEAFARAAEGLRTWQAHRLRGVRVFPADAVPRAGATVVVTLGTGLGAIAAPCRIVAVVEASERFGFAYGTLPGHPEQGEESFVVTIGANGAVRFDIRAFSRPGDLLTRLAGPLGRKMQSVATKGYLRALTRFVDQAGTN